MSMDGTMRLRLEAARAEALRRSRVREEAHSVARECAAQIAGLKDTIAQQVAAERLASVSGQLANVEHVSRQDPDGALGLAMQLADDASRAIASAGMAANRWTAEQAAQQARRTTLVTHMRALEGLGVVDTAAVRSALEADDLDRAATELTRARKVADQAGEQRAIVDALATVLRERGFRVEEDGADPASLRLVGVMPSGRRAQFVVPREGSDIELDLDGFRDRACRSELDDIRDLLEERFAVRSGIPQYTWHRPDGGAAAQMCGSAGNKKVMGGTK